MRPSREARLLEIKNILKQHKSIDINALSNMLSVSNVTIRSDLNELEKAGILYRMHGKAELRNDSPELSSANCIVSGFQCEFTKEQIYIGELAKTLISPNEWIFLGWGFTCAAVAYALRDLSINVLTSNLFVAAILSKNPAAQVMITGGYLAGSQRAFLGGNVLEDSMKGINVSKAFVGVSGIDIKFGFSISNFVEQSIFQNNIRPIAREIIVVAESIKFGKTSFKSVGKLEMANCIISDTGMPREYIDYFNSHNVKTITSL